MNDYITEAGFIYRNVNKAFTNLKRESLRLNRETLNLEFLNLCKNFEILPKHLRIINKTIKKNFYNSVEIFQKKILNLSIRKKKSEIYKIKQKSVELEKHLEIKVCKQTFIGMFDRITKYVEIQNKKIDARQIKKIQNMMKEKYGKEEKIQRQVQYINLSDRVFTPIEVSKLELGPKFAFPNKINLKKVIPQIEKCIKTIDYENQERVRVKIARKMEKQMDKSKGYFKSEDEKLVRKMQKDPDITILMTDKTNKLAILNKQDYKKKMIETIEKLECEVIKRNPYNNLRNKTMEIMKDSKWPEGIKFRMNNKTDIPQIFARLKDHKEGMPLRPIVDKTKAPTYLIEKALSNILKVFLPESNSVISSTNDFVSKIKEVNLKKAEIMVSLDVVSLYPSIDVFKVEEYIGKVLDENPDIEDKIKITIKRAIALIVRNNFFKFEDKVYKQKNGAPMGSPVSGDFAEFILRPMEDIILNDNDRFPNKPKIWLRYVDDVFIIWNETHDLQEFVNKINEMEPKIKFEIEKQENNILNFLDVTLEKKNGKISRSIYRKKIANQSIIPAQSQTYEKYKESAFHFMLRRAYTVCSRKNINDEIKKIHKIAKEAGYTMKFINRINKKIINNMKYPRAKELIKIKGSIEYHRGLSEEIKKIFKKEKIDIAIKNSNKLMQIIRNDKQRTEDNLKDGIYEIPYKEVKTGEEGVYIGQTGRTLKIRKTEHKDDIKKGEKKSELAKKYEECEIEIKFDDSKIIAPYIDKETAKLRETIEIITNKKCCNKTLSTKIPKIWEDLLRKSFKRTLNLKVLKNDDQNNGNKFFYYNRTNNKYNDNRNKERIPDEGQTTNNDCNFNEGRQMATQIDQIGTFISENRGQMASRIDPIDGFNNLDRSQIAIEVATRERKSHGETSRMFDGIPTVGEECFDGEFNGRENAACVSEEAVWMK